MLRTTMHWRIRYLRVNGSMLPTFVRNFLVHKGSQWVVYNATVVFVWGYEGGPFTRLLLSLRMPLPSFARVLKWAAQDLYFRKAANNLWMNLRTLKLN